MKKRTKNLIFNASGRLASKGAADYKIALQTIWVQQLLAAKFGNGRQ